MRDKEIKSKRNESIFIRYSELWASGQREELIWPVLKDEFFLAKDTIYRIVLEQSKTSPANH
ncbi:MAG: hypothetical protein WKF68_02540 [Daejeonella sp.]